MNDAFPLASTGDHFARCRAAGCRFFAFILWAVLAPGMVNAGTLRILPTGSDLPTYVDTSSIVRHGQTVELVYVNDFRTASGSINEDVHFRSESTRAIFDCAKKTYTVKAVAEYSDRAAGGNRNSSETMGSSAAKTMPIENKSTQDFVAKFACSRK